MSEIRIYVEGGRRGDEARMRKAWNAFLGEAHESARRKHVPWQVIPSGSRNQTYKNFCNALLNHPQAVNLLLVDSEEFVAQIGQVWQHLKARDNWDDPGVGNDLCHLMVCTMEAWFIADREKLTEYFRQPLATVSKYANVETVPKNTIEGVMARVSQGARHRTYDKIEDGIRLLETTRAQVVKTKAPHCQRFLEKLGQVMLAE